MSRPEHDVWVLDPRRWTARHSFAATICAFLLVVIALTSRGPMMETLEQVLAAALGLAMVALALTLTGVEHGGLIVGIVVSGSTLAHFSGHELLFESISALGSIAYLILGRSPKHLVVAPRLGIAWMRTSFWIIGSLGALLALRLEVGFTRGLYAASNLALAMAVVRLTRRTQRDLSLGVTATFLLVLGLLFLDGSTNVFDPLHPLPPGNLGPPLQERFWGGTHLAYGPNSIGMVALLIAMRVGGERAFPIWQRTAAVSVGVLSLALTASRTVLVVAAGVAALYFWLSLRRESRRGLVSSFAGIAPLLVVLLLLVAGGGLTFFTRGAADPTSGRTQTWRIVLDEFRDAPVPEKMLGNPDSARATVRRDVPGVGKWPTPTDNAVLGALRRAGIVGLAAFLVGIVLLIRRAVIALSRVSLDANNWWFPVAALATVPAIVTSDWHLGTIGHLSTVLLIGEASSLLRGPAARPDVHGARVLSLARRRVAVLVAFLGSVGVAAAQRSGALAPPSLWRDDTWQALVVKADSVGEIALLWSTAPGFAVTLKLLAETVGFSELRMQFVPFIAGVLAPPLTYAVSRRFGLTRWASIAAGAVIAVAPMHVTYSARVKPYTLEVLMTLLVLALGQKVAESPNSKGAWLALTAASVVTPIVSTPLALICASTLFASLPAWRAAGGREWRLPVASFGVFGLTAGALWVWIVDPASNPLLIAFWSRHLAPESTDPSEWLTSFGTTGGRFLEGLFPGPRPILGLLGLLVILGFLAAWRSRKTILLVLPMAAAIIAWALRLAPLGTGRTDQYLYPCLAIAIAFAIDALRNHARIVASIALVSVLAILAFTRTSEPYPLADTKPLVRIIDDRLQAADLAFIYPIDGYAYGLYTRVDIGIEPDENAMSGFAVVPRDPRVHIALPHWDRPAGYEHPEIRGQLRKELVRLSHRIAHRQPNRIWLLARSDTLRLSAYEAIVRGGGYERTDTIIRSGASLSLWERLATEDTHT